MSKPDLDAPTFQVVNLELIGTQYIMFMSWFVFGASNAQLLSLCGCVNVGRGLDGDAGGNAQEQPSAIDRS